MIATASKPIRKRRQTRARHPRRTGSVHAKPLLYADFSPRVQVGPNLYAGYYAKRLGMDPMGLFSLTDVAGLIPFLRTLVNAFTDPTGAKVTDYRINLDHDRCKTDPDTAEAQCRINIGVQAGAFAVQYQLYMHAGNFIEIAVGAGLSFIPGGGWIPGLALIIDGAINTMVTLYKYGKIHDAAALAQAKCLCPRNVACSREDEPTIQSSSAVVAAFNRRY